MITDNKTVGILKSRIEKLENENFDLEAWKAGTLVILERIFGPDSQKAREIEKIKYEQSSWALRDAKGSERLIDSCKRRGEEVLRAAIEELQYLGTEEDKLGKQKEIFRNVILGALENELKIAQLRELRQLLDSDIEEKEKRAKVIELLNSYGHDVVPNMLGSILVHPMTKELALSDGHN